ncbi:MAG: hypothetical protein JWQ48_4292 [Conexibacter sp.]|jgi:hypothetical protein|nr:hypothetical protein [Conexibacter sp.]
MAQAKTRARGKASASQRRGAAAKRGNARTGGDAPILPSVANHPRGGPQVKRARGWGGLVGFLLVALLSWRAHVPLPDTLLRALAGGIVAYLAVWACTVAVWRHLVLTELRVVRERRAAEASERQRTAAEQRGEAPDR